MDPRAANRADRRWPWGIVIGLAIVVLVNIMFAYMAVHGADSIVSSYNTESR